MRTRHTTAAALTAATLLLALTGCSSDTTDPKPAAASPTADAEQQLQACTDALYKVDSAAREAGTDPTDRVMPDPCVDLTADDYQDVILAVTQQLNEAARDDLQDQIDEAAEQDQ